MDGDGILLVGGTHPEVVGSDGANFGDHQVRTDLFVELFNGEDCVEGVFAGDEIFGLQFFAGARRETHFEMRGGRSYHGPAIPICSVQFSAEKRRDGMKIFCGRALAPKKSCGCLTGGLAGSIRCLSQTSLMRWFCQSVEETYAVCRRKELRRSALERAEGKILVDGSGAI